jgi:hypothetical protein
MPGGGAPAGIPMAKTVKPSDVSSSTVINPTGAPIRCGTTKITSYSDVVYSTPTTNGTKADLKLDIQRPTTSGKKPLVIYITGGGFVRADKTANLDQRTYVAEQGYVVASIQYRTVTPHRRLPRTTPAQLTHPTPVGTRVAGLPPALPRCPDATVCRCRAGSLRPRPCPASTEAVAHPTRPRRRSHIQIWLSSEHWATAYGIACPGLQRRPWNPQLDRSQFGG